MRIGTQGDGNHRDDTLAAPPRPAPRQLAPQSPMNGTGMENHELRKAGLKVTHPRMRILQLLEQKTAHHHMTAEDIYRHLLEGGDEIGLATVYRVLISFYTDEVLKF